MWILWVSQAKLERVLDYTKQTMVAYMREAELNRLCGYITEYSLGPPREVSPVSVDSALKSIDLMHFGWNIGKAFGKKRIHTATFIKRVFAHALRCMDTGKVPEKFECADTDFDIALSIIKTVSHHNDNIFNVLNEGVTEEVKVSETYSSAARATLLSILPDQFTSKDIF